MTESCRFHDPDFVWLVRRPMILVHRTRKDGAWGIATAWGGVCRLHRDFPVSWNVGRWIAGEGWRFAFARLRIESAQRRIVAQEDT